MGDHRERRRGALGQVVAEQAVELVEGELAGAAAEAEHPEPVVGRHGVGQFAAEHGALEQPLGEAPLQLRGGGDQATRAARPRLR